MINNDNKYIHQNLVCGNYRYFRCHQCFVGAYKIWKIFQFYCLILFHMKFGNKSLKLEYENGRFLSFKSVITIEEEIRIE